MGLAVRSCCSWMVLVALFDGLGFGCNGDGGLVRHGRQSEWWRSQQRAVPGQRSSYWGSRALSRGGQQAVFGFGFSRGTSRLGSPGRSASGVPRQLPQAASSPISVQCGEDTMAVDVKKDFFGTGKLVKISDLSLGPQMCPPNAQNVDMIMFQINLQDCGNSVQMNQDWLIYSTSLTYNPTSSIPVIRTNPAVVPITCYYYRHGNVSSEAIKPTWAPFSTTVSSEEKLSFSLQLMNGDWSGPRTSPVFQLGEILYIQASVDTQNHMNMMLYVDRCVASTSPDINIAPTYDIIADNGCLVDGVQEDTSSAFIAPRVSSNTLQFTVDAFRFLGTDVSLIYITCFLRAAPATQAPDSMNKACSYNKATTRCTMTWMNENLQTYCRTFYLGQHDFINWSAVEGPSSICQCCQTLTCLTVSPPVMGGGRGRFGRPRAFGKREALDEPTMEGETVTTLGPLLVIAPKQSDVALAVTKEASAPMELWMLAAVGCLSLLVVVACAVFIGRSVRKP